MTTQPEIAYMKNTVLFDKPYLWFQRKGEPLRLLNLDQANELARNELGILDEEGVGVDESPA